MSIQRFHTHSVHSHDYPGSSPTQELNKVHVTFVVFHPIKRLLAALLGQQKMCHFGSEPKFNYSLSRQNSSAHTSYPSLRAKTYGPWQARHLGEEYKPWRFHNAVLLKPSDVSYLLHRNTFFANVSATCPSTSTSTSELILPDFGSRTSCYIHNIDTLL